MSSKDAWLTIGEPMGKTITRKQVDQLRKEFASDPSNRVAQNAVTNVQLPDLTLNRNIVQDMDNSFSTKLDEWKVTAQMRSGRCWLFAVGPASGPRRARPPGVMDAGNLFFRLLCQSALLFFAGSVPGLYRDPNEHRHSRTPSPV